MNLIFVILTLNVNRLPAFLHFLLCCKKPNISASYTTHCTNLTKLYSIVEKGMPYMPKTILTCELVEYFMQILMLKSWSLELAQLNRLYFCVFQFKAKTNEFDVNNFSLKFLFLYLKKNGLFLFRILILK